MLVCYTDKHTHHPTAAIGMPISLPCPKKQNQYWLIIITPVDTVGKPRGEGPGGSARDGPRFVQGGVDNAWRCPRRRWAGGGRREGRAKFSEHGAPATGCPPSPAPPAVSTGVRRAGGRS